MKTLGIIKYLAAIFISVLLLNSCEKVDTPEPLGDAGQTLVKMNPEGFSLVALNAATTTQKAVMFDIRRDVVNEMDLNTAATVVIQKDDAVLTAYNTANKKTFTPLPVTLGTSTPAPAADGKITLEFAPGEFAKSIVITIPDASKFDFSLSYALGYKILSVTGAGKLSQAVSKDIVTQVLVKNKYDGKYKMKGFIMRPGDTGGLEGFFSGHEKIMATSGSTSVAMSPNQLWANGGGVGGIGTWSFNVIETGTPPYKITITDPVAANWLVDPAYPNRYDPATKTFYFKVNWGGLPYIRGCTDTLVYVGPR